MYAGSFACLTKTHHDACAGLGLDMKLLNAASYFFFVLYHGSAASTVPPSSVVAQARRALGEAPPQVGIDLSSRCSPQIDFRSIISYQQNPFLVFEVLPPVCRLFVCEKRATRRQTLLPTAPSIATATGTDTGSKPLRPFPHPASATHTCQ